jgi:uncharacterized protein (DUF3820 family)
MPQLTFGKYEGYAIEDPKVPTSYIDWMYNNSKGTTKEMFEAELKRRSEGATTGTQAKLSRGEFAEKLMSLILKMPEGLNEQKVQANGYEITIKKIF